MILNKTSVLLPHRPTRWKRFATAPLFYFH